MNLPGKKNLSKCVDCEKAFKEEQGLKELFMRGKESIAWNVINRLYQSQL